MLQTIMFNQGRKTQYTIRGLCELTDGYCTHQAILQYANMSELQGVRIALEMLETWRYDKKGWISRYTAENQH